MKNVAVRTESLLLRKSQAEHLINVLKDGEEFNLKLSEINGIKTKINLLLIMLKNMAKLIGLI